MVHRSPSHAPSWLFWIAMVCTLPVAAATRAVLPAAHPTALGPWLTCDVTFTGPNGASLPVRFAHVPAAITDAQQRAGLNVAAVHGRALMVFAFQTPGFRPFWMKGVASPLSVAFMDAHGRIMQIKRMQPDTTRFYWSRLPFVWAMEAPTPTFRRFGIVPGSHVHFSGCPALPGKEKPAL